MDRDVQIKLFDLEGLQYFYNTKVKNIVVYAECNSAAQDSTKIINIDDIEIKSGTIMLVNFKNGNTNSSPQLKINDLSAKQIVNFNNSITISANQIVLLVYSGTNWQKI